MGSTPIEWTATVNADGSVTPGKVWNPVTGCHKVSPGCKHCYAEGIAKRFWRTQYPPVLVNPLPDQLREGIEAVAGQGQSADYDAAAGTRPREFTDVQTHADRLSQPFSWKKPCKVFVNSMSDLFEEDVPFEFIDQVFTVMALCQHLTFIVLTKRPARMCEYITRLDQSTKTPGHQDWPQLFDAPHRDLTVMIGEERMLAICETPDANSAWPLPNVWLLVSIENQKYADERIPILLDTPAAVRGVSYEPALGPGDLSPWLGNTVGFEASMAPARGPRMDALTVKRGGLDWVIVGGESGPGARPFSIAWARAIVQQCAAAGVACFVKQLGANPGFWEERVTGNAYGDCDDDSTWHPFGTSAGKGGDMAEWPEDLRVRQFPEARQ